MRLRSLPRVAVLAGALVALAALAALAETVYVKVATARILDKPDAFEGKELKRAGFRDKLERLEKLPSGWDRVRLKSKSGEITEGYVRTSNLSTEQPKESKQGSNRLLTALAGGQGGPENVKTAGAEGLTEMGRDYTKNNNLEKGRLIVEGTMDKMTTDLKAHEAFLREGRLGDYAAPRPQKGGGQ